MLPVPEGGWSPVVTQGRVRVDEGYYVDDIYIGEEDQRWRTQLTESIYMTALLGSSVTDDDEGLGVKSCFSETEDEERARGRESLSSVEMGWTYKVYTKQK